MNSGVVYANYLRFLNEGLESFLNRLYPKIFPLHDLDSEEGVGYATETGGVLLPTNLPATVSSISRTGVYAVDDGDQTYIIVGDSVPPEVVQAIFGWQDLDELCQNYYFPSLDESYEYHQRVVAILEEMKRLTNKYGQTRTLLIQGDENYQVLSVGLFVEDSSKLYPVSLEKFLQSFVQITD